MPLYGLAQPSSGHVYSAVLSGSLPHVYHVQGWGAGGESAPPPPLPAPTGTTDAHTAGAPRPGWLSAFTASGQGVPASPTRPALPQPKPPKVRLRLNFPPGSYASARAAKAFGHPRRPAPRPGTADVATALGAPPSLALESDQWREGVPRPSLESV